VETLCIFDGPCGIGSFGSSIDLVDYMKGSVDAPLHCHIVVIDRYRYKNEIIESE
jgi:hypothetical protein